MMWRGRISPGAPLCVALLGLLLLAGCGRAGGGEVVAGPLRAGDRDYWLVGATLVALGGAEIGGEPSQPGAAVRAEGRRQPDGVFRATRITVGRADPAAAAGSLPSASASGAVEALDPATGRWRIAGRRVQLVPGAAAPAGIAVGDRATAAGYALPDGGLLAASITPERAAPAMPPSGAAPAPTAAPIRVEALVSDPAPPRSARMTVTGALRRGDAGIAGVPMRTVWHFRTGDATCHDGITGPDGRAECTLRMSAATPGHEVVVDVIFEYEGRTYQTQVRFTPR